MSARHTVTVGYAAGWGEYLPCCTCGWVGSYWSTQDYAERDADKHLTEVAA